MARNTQGTPDEKIKNENKEGVDDVKVKRELYEKNQELKAKDEEITKLKVELELAAVKKAATLAAPVSQVPDSSTLDQLKSQIETLQRQMIGLAPVGSKLMFKEPTPADLVEPGEEVTFTARSILYVVASYRDYRGIEKLPPHKLIIFTYAASDRRKDGREEQIINFSQYTTNLKTEIEFLRGHPFFGISFSDNTTEMANEDVYEINYRIRAATQLATMTPEVIFDRAREYKIPNFQKKSAEQLRHLIVMAMAADYKAEYKRQQEDLIKRQALRQLASNNKEE
jgi:hypothetical protein